MTENEKIIEEANEIAKGRMYATNEVIRFQKELEQYRAIGTVEECRNAVAIVKKMYEHCEGSCGDCPYHNPNIPNKCMNDLLK